MKNPSAQQKKIFEVFAQGKKSGHVVLDARAGSGKTTTVLAGIDLAPEQNILLCAFNKQIAEELKGRLTNPRATAKTLHALGLGLITRRWGRVNVDGKRGFKLAEKVVSFDGSVTDEMLRTRVKNVAAVVSKAKNMLPFATVKELTALVVEEIDAADLKDVGPEVLAGFAFEAMKAAEAQDGTGIDFDDMVWLPVRLGMLVPQYDLVVVDECQDMCATQILLAQGVCSGRMIVVGDPFQAIYGFRGADSGSMARLEKELSAKRMGLTITYRCPKSVVALAQKLVPDFHAAPTAPEGTVSRVEYGKAMGMPGPGDFFLSRKNAPLIRACLAFLRDGKRAIVRGRDIGAGLRKVVKAQKTETVVELLGKLEGFYEATIANLIAADASEARIERAQDEHETVIELSAGLTKTAELEKRLEDLFSDNNFANSIICSSVHKAKGLESERVFLLTDTLYPGRNRRTKIKPAQEQEERNIEYVAITRSKANLVLVSGLSS
jgi:superfamily I DNA/RNA helicase